MFIYIFIIQYIPFCNHIYVLFLIPKLFPFILTINVSKNIAEHKQILPLSLLAVHLFI